MQEALQLRWQRVQLLHFVVSMVMRNSENRDNKPSSVPTGQMVLQYVRPLRHANMTIIISVRIAVAKTLMLFSHTSTS